MNKSFEKQLVTAICVMFPHYLDAEKRDQKIILAMAFMVYLSSLLGGYAMYVSTYFLLKHGVIAFIIGACTTGFLILHDQSLLATDRRRQIYTKILISAFLAIGFTMTNNATKEYDTLSTELIQATEKSNANITIAMNRDIEKVEEEEREIRKRIEIAGLRINETKQPLIDARRSLAAFELNKEERLQRIREAYSPKYEDAQISDLTVLAQQAKKFASGGEGTFIAVLLAFLFFIIESLPAILRIMLDDGDYMKRFLASLNVMRALRDQRIKQQLNFASADSDIVRNILHMEIIDKKNEMIATNFENTEEMLILDKRQKILDAGYNPYTGESLDFVDLSFFDRKKSTNEDKNSSTKEGEDTNFKENNNQNHKQEQEAVFDL